MANSFFRFKQFEVRQDACAMKVCTDACLFGSILPVMQELPHSSTPVQYFKTLDIGAGTGLLSLMYAQKEKNVVIEAVEIDSAAAGQARGNFSRSPWADRLTLIEGDISKIQLLHQYDLIFSNPPFFENHLRSKCTYRNLAMHSEALPLGKLFQIVQLYLKNEGLFCLLLPAGRAKDAEELASEKYGLFAYSIINVRQTPSHDFFRSILFLKRLATETSYEEITIQNSNGEYSTEFTRLLKDYYLYM